MAPIEVMFAFIAAVGVAVAVVASMRIMREKESLGRSSAQMAFVWLVPFIGPLVTIQLLRKEPERGSGIYPSEQSSLEDGDRIRQRDATFEPGSEGHSNHGGGSHE